MKFQKIEIRQIRIPFRFSFKHALADRKAADSVLIRLYTDSTSEGWGECVPREYLTGETVQSVIDTIKSDWWPALREIDFSLQRSPYEKLRPLFLQATENRTTASYAGVDIAVYDAIARCCGKPLSRLLGWKEPEVLLTAPLGGSSFHSVKKKARWFKFLGFKQFKIKLGMGIDREICAASRAILGDDLSLRADCNAGWTLEEALEAIPKLDNFFISSFEQPVASIEDMAVLKSKLPVLLMADESLCSLQDAQDLISQNAADMWNLRLAKIGGFTGLMEFLQLAEQHHILLHLGTLVGETSLLAAAGRIACGAAGFSHIEYGFPRIFLKGDPFRGGPAGYFGTGIPQCSGTGLGVSVNPKALDKVTMSQTLLE